MRNRSLVPICMLAVSIGFALPAQGNEDPPKDWFEIELIVFQHLGSGTDDSEQWPIELMSYDYPLDAIELLPSDVVVQVEPVEAVEAVAPEEPLEPIDKIEFVVPESLQNPALASDAAVDPVDLDADSITEPLDPAPTAPPDWPSARDTLAYQTLAENELKQLALWQKLRGSAYHKPLLHLGWRQSSAAGESTSVVRVHTGLSLWEQQAVNEKGQLTPLLDNVITAEALVPVQAEILGTLQVTRQRYLHVQADLLFRDWANPELETGPLAQNQPGQWSGIEMQPFQAATYRLNETRRLRSNRLHYLDHPKFGMVVIITPFEFPIPEADQQEDPDQVVEQ